MPTANNNLPDIDLPDGVTPVDTGNPAPAPIPVNAQAIPITDHPPETAAGGWNFLEIAAGVILTTLFLFSIQYFRQRTNLQAKDSTEKDRKIMALQNDMTKVKQIVAA